VTVLTS